MSIEIKILTNDKRVWRRIMHFTFENCVSINYKVNLRVRVFFSADSSATHQKDVEIVL